MYIDSSKIRINQPGRAARLILCLELHAQFPEGFNFAQRVPEMVAQVRAARDAGFASLWFPHHWLTHPMQMLQITPGFAALLPRFWSQQCNSGYPHHDVPTPAGFSEANLGTHEGRLSDKST